MKRRKDGRLQKSFVDEKTGKRIYFYGASEREIYQKMMEYEARHTRGRTFAAVAREWWNANEPRWASQSIKTYSAAYDRALNQFGPDPIAEITPREVHRLLRILASQGFKQKTISNQRTVINQIMAYALLCGDIQYNPVASVSTPKCATGERRQSASTKDEEIAKVSADVWLFPSIAIYTGLRKGEILALQWKDIDFKHNTISVYKSVYHEGDKPKIKEPKTKESRRTVPLLAPLKEILQPRAKKSFEYIISDTGEKPLTQKRYDTLMRHYHSETGTTFTAHQLRHSFATIAIEQGLDAKIVQTLLGHKQISTTLDIYTDFRDSSLRRAEAALNDAFSPEKTSK